MEEKMSKLSALFVVLGLLAFGGFVLNVGGPFNVANAAEEAEADVATPAPEEGAEEAVEGEQEEGEEKAEEGAEQPE
jgi:hypothetical protein